MRTLTQAETEAMHEASDAEREANNQRKAAQKAADEAQRKAKIEADFKEHSKRAYIKSGGDPLTFDVKWPSLREDIVKAKTVAAGKEYQTTSEVAAATLKKLYAR